MSRSEFVVRRPRSRVCSRSVPATLLALVVLGACGISLDIAGVEKSVQDGIAQQLDLAMSSVTCPSESRAAKAGDTFECTGKPEIGGSISVQVTQKDDLGNIEWKVLKSTGLFDMRETEAAVERGLADQVEAEVEISCGDRWRVGEVGDTFECEGKDADGPIPPVTITVKDAEGNISWAM